MGRRVLITGATRGIGKEVAKTFHEAGYRVAVNYNGNEETATKFTDETGIQAFKWDASDFQACQEGVKEVEQYFGGNVEVLVNNAGITRDAMLHKQSFEGWKDVIDTNLGSVFNMSRAVIEQMRSNEFGRIISMSSVNANGTMGQTNYSASKAGIEGFTKSLALESARKGITVNAIAPGYINTEMVAAIPEEVLNKIIAGVPVKRLGEASEIARTVLFLAQEESGFITGAVFPINGGLRV